jgi:cytochrome P450 family 135
MVFIADPELIEEIYKASPKLMHAGEGRMLLEPLVGSNSVLLLDEDPHMRHRKLMLPAFHGERMKAYRELIAEVTERELARWPRGEPFPVWPSMQAITLDVIMRAVFGFEEGDRLDRLREALKRMLDATQSPLVIFVVLTLRFAVGLERTRTQFDKNLKRIDELLFEEIRARRRDQDFEDRTDVLSVLMQARDEDGRELTDQELRDELITLLIAGHETTATTLAWTFERIVRHPEVLDRLHDGAGEDYIDAVMKETLRLRPILPITPRKLMEPTDLGGWSLPANAVLAPCIYLVHRRPDVYPEPDRFRPERFLDKRPDTYAWIPFGGGIRRCIGATFAHMEMDVVLRVLVERVAIAPTDAPGEGWAFRGVAMAPARGGRAVVRRRA